MKVKKTKRVIGPQFDEAVVRKIKALQKAQKRSSMANTVEAIVREYFERREQQNFEKPS